MDDEIVAEFLVESHENLDQLDRDLVALEQQPGSRELISSVFRTIHTIKGTSGFLAFERLERLTHVGENLLSRLRDGAMTMDADVTTVLLRLVDTVRALLASIEQSGADTDTSVAVDPVVAELEAVLAGGPVAVAPVAETPAPVAVTPVVEPVETLVPGTPVAPVAVSAGEAEEDTARSLIDASIRVDVGLLDTLVQLVGELVLTRNQILQCSEGARDAEFLRASQRLNLVASELQESVMRTRMQPIGQVWAKMPRIVRDLACQLGREVNLEMEGHDTELDRSLLEALKGPLTHLVRNALDHGLEPPAGRAAAGKPAAGRLQLRAFHESGQVVVEITDDGRGIDPVRVADTAVARGVVSRERVSHMDAREIQELLFRPGFSTAEQVTHVSGRGVGMDVVRTSIERIGGTVDLVSEVGRGTTCRVRIPLTLAIIPALIVGQAGERYALPQANLIELVRLAPHELGSSLESVGGAPLMRLRGRLLPLVELADVLGSPPLDREDGVTVIVLQADDLCFGLVVETVHDTQEIVVKPIGRQLKAMSTYAGATIMGDGRIALILDVAGIGRGRVGRLDLSETVSPESVVDPSGAVRSLLVLEVAGGARAALPLAAVSRLEEFDPAQVERAGGREVAQYRGGLLPLVRLAPAIGLPDVGGQPDTLVVVVVPQADGAGAVGLVIDRVVDVAEEAVVADPVGRRQGVLGSAVVQGRVTDLVDLEQIVGGAGVSRVGAEVLA